MVIENNELINLQEDIINYTHLHVHTNYSTWESTIYIDQLINKAVECQMSSVAITDKGSIEGVEDFYHAAIKNNIKPIIGCEFFLAPQRIIQKNGGEKRHHITLLAENNTGYENICRLNQIAQTKGYYYDPRIDKELLSEFNGGLIALSGCIKGEIPSLLLQDRFDEAKNVAILFSEIFSEHRFYLEVQFTENHKMNQISDRILKIGSDLSIPVVLTNNCHYLEKEDELAHDLLMGIKTGAGSLTENRFSYATKEFYFKCQKEMSDICQYPHLLEMTQEIAHKCNVEL